MDRHKPPQHLQLRHDKVRRILRAKRLDAILLTHPADLAWLSDFTGHDSIGILTLESAVLVTDFRYDEQAAQEAPWLRRVIRADGMAEALARTCKSLGTERIAFEEEHFSVGQMRALEKALRKARARGAELVSVSAMLVNARKIKDEVEVQITRDAIACAQDAFKAILPRIRVGMTESELAGQLLLEMRRRGASDASFPPIVAAGPNGSLPHYRPGMLRIQPDQPLLIDWGALYRGYCSDLTRTLFIGRVAPKMREIYRVVLEAQAAAIATIRPGATTRSVDAAARKVIAAAGYGPRFGHGTGHGIGRDIHERPTLGRRSKPEPLAPGMIVTVEPGIYLPGIGGVRIEDDVLVTPSGCEVLSNLDRSLKAAQL